MHHVDGEVWKCTFWKASALRERAGGCKVCCAGLIANSRLIEGARNDPSYTQVWDAAWSVRKEAGTQQQQTYTCVCSHVLQQPSSVYGHGKLELEDCLLL